MFKKGFVIIFLFILIDRAHARGPVTSDGDRVRITGKLGYNYKRRSFFEGGMLIYRDWGEGIFNSPAGFYGAYLGGEMQLVRQEKIFGPCAGFEGHYGIFGARSNITYLTDFSDGAFQFSLEGGLSFFGFVYVMAGYNQTFTHRDFIDYSGFKLSAGVNFSFVHVVGWP